MASEKRGKPLRVVVADDHHHVLPEIHLAIRKRALPFTDIHVLHFDAHPDLSFPKAVDPALVFHPEELYDALDESISGIAEFLLPLVYGGHVSQIAWIKPHWAWQMPIQTMSRAHIGKDMATNALCVSLPLAHFIEEGSYAPVDAMDPASLKYVPPASELSYVIYSLDVITMLCYAGVCGQRQWGLVVAELPDETQASTAESSSNSVILEGAMTQLREMAKGYVLDIDLDYFSTWNPFRKDLEQRVGTSISDVVARVFCGLRYKNMQNSMNVAARMADRRAFVDAMEQVQHRELFLDPTSLECQEILAATLLGLYSEGIQSARQLLTAFFEILAELDEDARKLVWWAGPNMDLPHHMSSDEEIERMIGAFKDFLVNSGCQGKPPALITVAKSIGDEYLPPHQVEFVLSRVLSVVRQVFGELEVEYVEYQSMDGETNGGDK